jgi:UDP:flavonoid glycosyltransferase YjiC (YdhE family)
MRIVFATFGSLGDLHPVLAIGLELQARGHRAVVVSSEVHREQVEAAGLTFHPSAPSLRPDDKELLRQTMDAGKGPERVIRGVMMPALRQSYADLEAAVHADGGADLLVSSEIAFAAPILADRLGLRWASMVLAPISFFSRHDPPVLPALPGLRWIQRMGPGVNRVLLALGRRMAAGWTAPVHELRRELGLPPVAHPIFEGKHARDLVLALFSRELGAPQPDWPRQVVQTGFAFHDRLEPGAGLSPQLARFLAEGDPPVVFTLGSAAVFDAGRFYLESIDAAARLGRRSVLLLGFDPDNVPQAPLPAGVIAVEYAPFSELFPRAAAVVHQGGVGTTGQAMRAGRPMLVMPFSHDQPDNAARVVRMGMARIIERRQYRADRAAAALRDLLDDPAYHEAAARVRLRMAGEQGAGAAAEAILGGLGQAAGRRSVAAAVCDAAEVG